MALLATSAAALPPQQEAYCFAVADSGDNLVFLNKDGDGFVDLGLTGTGAIEAIAFNPGVSACDTTPNPPDRMKAGCLYATNNDDFGFLDYDDSWDGDLNDSEFIQVSADVGTCTLPGGGPPLAINDVDGLQFDVTRTDASTGTFVLWATVRTGGNDVLFQIDPNTGLVDVTPTPGFVGGATCVPISGAQPDIDDIAADPTDGRLFAVSNGAGADQLVTLNPVTGVATAIGIFDDAGTPVTDMEGFSFGFDGQLYGTTGASSTVVAQRNSFWAVDKTTGTTTGIVTFPALTDYESVACLTDNVIRGTVFRDVDGDGVLQTALGDRGFAGARIVVYIDNNNDGLVDGGDTPLCDNPAGGFNLACPLSDDAGDYVFAVGQGNFVAAVDTTTLPIDQRFSTDNVEMADFATTGFGLTDPDNDFGFTGGGVCYLVADEYGAGSQDELVAFDLVSGTGSDIGPTTIVPPGTATTIGVEAVAIQPGTGTLFAFDEEEVFTLDLVTATATKVGNVNDGALTCRLPASQGGGTVTVDNIDAAGFDPTTGFLWASEEEGGVGVEDVLLRLDPANGQFVLDAFGAGVDCLRLDDDISATGGGNGSFTPALDDMDDIAVDPTTGTLYGMLNDPVNDRLVTIDTTSGLLTSVGLSGTPDVEGLGFTPDGVLFGSTGASSTLATDDSVVQIDKTSGATLSVTAIGIPADYESIDCTAGALVAITKTSNATGPVTQGQKLTYTVVVTNPSGVRQTGISVSDLLPPGVTYDPQSTVATGPVAGNFRDEFSAIAYNNSDGSRDWTSTPWVETNDPGPPAGAGGGSIRITGGELLLEGSGGGERIIERPIDLRDPVTLAEPTGALWTFDWRCVGDMETADAVNVEVFDGTSWTTLDTKTGEIDMCPEPGDTNSGSDSYDLGRLVDGNVSDSRIRFRYTISAADEDFFIDDVNIEVFPSTSTSKDNMPAGFSDLVGGAPPSLIAPADRFVLASGQTLTVTLAVDVDDPMSPYRSALSNTALVSTDQTAVAEQATHVDPVASGTIGDRVWLDTDGDGVEDIGEEGIANVEVTLYDVGADGLPGGGDDSVIATRLTGVDGGYLFEDLAPGTYWVDVGDGTVPTGLAQSPGNPDPATSPLPTPTYTVTSNQRFLGADFGYTSAAGTGVVGDHVWNDMDRDGVQDPGEVGWSGVTLDLVSAGVDGLFGTADDVVDQSTTTGADGFYLFTAVAVGEYRVEVTDTGGVLASAAPTAGPQSVGSATSPPVTVSAGEVLAGVDFGYAPGACLPRIDFETDAAGNPLAAGDVIASQWSAWGVTVSFTVNAPSTGPLMIFDSANVTGMDDDLGSPNETCTPPGPGQGTAGEVGQAGENCFPQDNILIISEDGDSSDPDDAGDGGTITFSFGDDTRIEAVEFLDAENNLDSVELFDSVPSSIFFSNLTAPGDNAFELLPVNTGGARSMVITFPASGALGAIDFCLGSIRDKVWLDSDNDGLFDVGETGISGVTVNLLSDPDGVPASGDEIVVATTTTDADGNFGFDGLEDGDYVLAITDTAGKLVPFSGTTAAALAAELGVTIAGGDDFVGIDFGYNAEGLLGDRVWSDADGDGVQDPGEAGIGGVLLDLLDGMGNPVVDGMGTPITTTTAADGSYFFLGVAPGGYLVAVAASNFAAMGPLVGYVQTGDPDEPGACATCDNRGSSTLAFGASDLSLDFGYRNLALADISGTVFEDADADGVQDAGENGFAGVTVALLDAMSNIVATTTTDASGAYTFPDLPAGSYSVTVTDEAAILAGYSLTSGLDRIPVTVAGADVGGVDFGYVRDPDTGAIGDRVWFDANRNGIQEASEGGIAGVTLDLIDVGPDGLAGTGDDGGVVATTTTDANGDYLFVGLVAGSYQLDVTDTGGRLTGLAPTTGTTDPSAVTSLSEGEQYRQADFGYAPAADSALGDTIFSDVDSNGFQDPGEVGIAGVTVTLIDAGPDRQIGGGDDVVVGSAVTDARGEYLFLGIGPGSANCTQASPTECIYYVQVDTMTLPAGYDPAPTNGPALRPFGVFAGEDVLFADFGFNDPTTGSIGDTVYLDVDGDGSQDAGEPGIEGVTVDLVDDATGTVLATMTTDANGSYDFVGLPPGDYNVVVTDVGSVLALFNPSQTPTLPITITAAGEDVDTADFGYVPSNGVGSIGNQLWRDKNGDGLFNPPGDDGIAGTSDDEVGFEGVTVQLWLDDGDGTYEPFSGDDNLVRTTETEVDGTYELLALPAGTYFVTVSDTSGVLAGFTKTVGPMPGINNNSQSQPGYRVDITAVDPLDQTADFGYQADQDLAISGTVFFDTNGDGVFDSPAEMGVDSVELFLFRDLDGDMMLDPGEPQIDRVTVSDGTIDVDGDGMIDPVGFYAFIDLPPGSFIVTADPSASFVDSLPQTTQQAPPQPEGGIQPVTLVAADSNGNHFGFTVRSTAVLISSFEARAGSGGVLVRWETASQSGTVGFYLYRETAEAGWTRVNERLLPAVLDAPQGAVYELVDEQPTLGSELVYSLVEVEAAGAERTYGPFRPELLAGPQVADVETGVQMSEPIEGWRATARARSERMERRLSAMKSAQAALGVEDQAGGSVGLESSPRMPQRPGRRPTKTDLRLKVEVDHEGLYFVSAEEIATRLELPVGSVRLALRTGSLALSSGGEPVAWEGSAEGLTFFGTGVESPYTRSNVYWLDLGVGRSVEVAAAAGAAGGATSFAETLHVEEDVFSVTVVADSPVEDFYYWALVAAGDPLSGTATVAVDVEDPVVGGGAAQLAVHLQGVTSTPAAVDHRALVRWNGVAIGETEWDGASPHTAVFGLPGDLLTTGANLLEVEGLLDGGLPYSTFLLDSVDLGYERALRAVSDRLLFLPAQAGPVTVSGFSAPGISVYDVTEPKEAVRHVGASESPGDGWTVAFVAAPDRRYLVVGGGGVEGPVAVRARPKPRLGEARSGIDYVVIAPAELTEAAQSLVGYRAAFGLSAKVFELETIQDVFAHGLSSPEAIRDFLSWGWSEWATAPRFAVLAGGGTFDYKNVQGIGGNLVPPLMTQTPYGLFATDSVFGDVEGEDGIAEIAVGRIPVLTAEELTAYVAKMAAHEGAAGGSPSVLFLSDDGDDAGSFPATTEALVAQLPPGLASESISLADLPLSEARQRLFDAIAAGVSAVNYQGHAGLSRLASEGLIVADDAATLVGPELPVFSALTCSAGRFEVPGFESLAEALVMAPQGGAAVVFAPTGQALHFEAAAMNRAWIEALFSGESSTVGEAALAALAYEQKGPFPFMRRIFQLLGDPAFAID